MTDMADKINKLLRKAEETEFPEEAETFMAAARRLMEQYAIDEAMLAAKQDRPREEIVEATIECPGVHRHVLKKLAFAVLDSCTCKGFFRNRSDLSPKQIDVVVCGYESDVARVRLLHTSAQLQLETARIKWAQGHPTLGVLSRSQKRLARRDFGFGFAEGLAEQLQAAAAAGKEDAVAAEAERSGVSSEEASESVALVVRDRADSVKDWFDQTWGSSLRTVRQNYKGSRTDSRSSGAAAGRSADMSAGGDRVSGAAAPALGAAS